MNNKLILGILIFVVATGVGLYFFGGSKSQHNSINVQGDTQAAPIASPTVAAGAATASGQPGSDAVVSKVSVTLNDSGFSPATITVRQGTTVTFVNQSSTSMWVASNPHPTHTDLPGFDELSSVNNGGTYQYTFEKIGTWKYHNHLSPRDGGTVVVNQ